MIIVENLYFSYKDDEILQNLNFRVNSGKWISIIGGNGSAPRRARRATNEPRRGKRQGIPE
ncbi:MAG: hypothetical protein Q8851_01660, partial [Sweet potato little leaf phytoplasma]|nr:hypothetical protein [Sweet potato little leaf phytoplasma]